MRGGRTDRTVLVQILALFSLAITYPLLEVLGRSPEFFVAHRLEGLDLAVFVLIVGGIAPASVILVAWIAGRIGQTLVARVTAVMRALMAAAIVLQALRHVPAPGPVLVLIALAAGVAVDVGCRLASPVRLFVTLLSPAVVLGPLLFVVWSPASTLFGRPANSIFGDEAPAVSMPVVFVVFDQLPLVSLLDANGAVDRSAYPHFAALADTATWFRQTSTVADATEWALPAILTGRYPRRNLVPTAASHPDNLFTGLYPAYGLHVEEPMTWLCAPRLCPDETPLRARLAAASADAPSSTCTRCCPRILPRPFPMSGTTGAASGTTGRKTASSRATARTAVLSGGSTRLPARAAGPRSTSCTCCFPTSRSSTSPRARWRLLSRTSRA